MLKMTKTLLLLATLAAPAVAQDQEPEAKADTSRGSIVIEHGGDRIVIRIGSSMQRPEVEINGVEVGAEEWRADGKSRKLSTSRGPWEFEMTPPSFTWEMANRKAYENFYGKDSLARGLATWMAPTAGYEGITWEYQPDWQAVPGQQAKKPHVGVQVASVPSALTDHLELDPRRCVLVASVTEGGPAAAAGLQKNDILIGIGDEAGATEKALRAAVSAAAPGDELEFEILRRADRRRITVEVGEKLESVWGSYMPLWSGAELSTKSQFEYAGLPSPIEQSQWLTLWDYANRGAAPTKSIQEQLDAIKKQCEALQQQLEQLQKQVR